MKRVHEFTIKLSFNKPITKSDALIYAKQEIHGVHFLDGFYTDDSAQRMRVGSIKHKQNPKGEDK